MVEGFLVRVLHREVPGSPFFVEHFKGMLVMRFIADDGYVGHAIMGSARECGTSGILVGLVANRFQQFRIVEEDSSMSFVVIAVSHRLPRIALSKLFLPPSKCLPLELL